MKKKWIIIIAVVAVLWVIGTLTKKDEKVEEVATVEEPVVELTYKEQFEKKHADQFYGSYKPVRKYLKEYLNDPGSLEIEAAWIRQNPDSTFYTKTLFRARNQFNALIKQNIHCDIDMDGNLYNIRFE